MFQPAPKRRNSSWIFFYHNFSPKEIFFPAEKMFLQTPIKCKKHYFRATFPVSPIKKITFETNNFHNKQALLLLIDSRNGLCWLLWSIQGVCGCVISAFSTVRGGGLYGNVWNEAHFQGKTWDSSRVPQSPGEALAVPSGNNSHTIYSSFSISVEG